MNLYNEHKKYAADVLKIIEYVKYDKFNVIKHKVLSHCITPKKDIKQYRFKYDLFCSISTENYESGYYPVGTFCFGSNFVFRNNNKNKVIIMDKNFDGRVDEAEPYTYIKFTEELHFQQSLIYPENTLKILVLAGELYYSGIAPNYIELNLECVTILSKLIRYTESGIIKVSG